MATFAETLRRLFRGGECPRCQAKDEILQALRAELERAGEREKKLDAQVAQLQTKVTALADPLAAARAARIENPTPPTEPRKPPSVRLPQYVGQLARGRQINLEAVRRIQQARPRGPIPPVVKG